MKRKKYSEIITKEDRDEFLKYLMERELEKIRKKIYKYKRCNAIWYPITIEEIEFEDNRTAGCYIWDEENEIHKIYIADILLNRYLRLSFNSKKYSKEFLIDTIGHELTHALVQELFEHRFSNIKEKNRDGSPIFLASLQYLGYKSGHHCGYNYRWSKVWKDINELKKNNYSWNDFKRYIILYLQEINDIREKFNNENLFFQHSEEYQLLGQTVDFRFSSRGSGLHKASQSTFKSLAHIRGKEKLKKIDTTKTIFEIGSMMYPELIRKLLIKKISNDATADISSVRYWKLVIDNETNYNRGLYKKEEMYSKYEQQKIA